MKDPELKALGCIGCFVLIACLAGCAAFHQSGQSVRQSLDTDRVIADLTPDIEKLYLSWHALDQTYKDIKFLERGFLFDPDDRQLGYIQKIGLYIQDASVRIHHRWDQLSILHYILPELMRDYLTLTSSALTSTEGELIYDQRFIHIYSSFVRNEAVREDVNRAQDQMNETIDVLKRIREKLIPFVNAPITRTALSTTPSVKPTMTIVDRQALHL